MLLCVYAFHQVVGDNSVNNAVLAQKTLQVATSERNGKCGEKK